MTETESKIEKLEEAMAHLARTNEELSGELAFQWKRIERLESSLRHLENRFEEIEADKPDTPANEKPPHW